MSTPLRWAHPESYLRLQTMAREVGVHSYDYHAFIEDADGGRKLVIRRGDSEWSEIFPMDELTEATASVMTFFENTVGAMAESAKQEYLDYMDQREV